MAKALANGLPIGAMLIDAKASRALQPGDHGTTFGASPLPCAAALAHLRARDASDFDARVRAIGTMLRDGLAAIAERYPAVFEAPRGIGLMLGLPVREPFKTQAFVDAGRKNHRILLNGAEANTLRFVPPLVIGEPLIVTALERLDGAIASAATE